MEETLLTLTDIEKRSDQQKAEICTKHYSEVVLKDDSKNTLQAMKIGTEYFLQCLSNERC